MPRRPKGSPKPIAKTAARMSRRAALTPDQLKKLDAYWRASNYLAACQLYLLDNPLLKEPLEPAHIKKENRRPLGYRPWPELHLYTPQPRHQPVRPEHDLPLRPRPRGNAMVAQTYLEGPTARSTPTSARTRRG